MVTNKRWQVEIQINEQERMTRAVARLHGRDRPGHPGADRDDTDLVAAGLARLNPVDRNVPEIGDELAVARALSELSHRLLEAAAGDIEQITHHPAHLSR